MRCDRTGRSIGEGIRSVTLWSDFLRRLMVTATLSGPAVAAAEPPAPPTEPPAEMGEPSASRVAPAPPAKS
jgi:hypothetical protein